MTSPFIITICLILTYIFSFPPILSFFLSSLVISLFFLLFLFLVLFLLPSISILIFAFYLHEVLSVSQGPPCPLLFWISPLLASYPSLCGSFVGSLCGSFVGSLLLGVRISTLVHFVCFSLFRTWVSWQFFHYIIIVHFQFFTYLLPTYHVSQKKSFTPYTQGGNFLQE